MYRVERQTSKNTLQVISRCVLSCTYTQVLFRMFKIPAMWDPKRSRRKKLWFLGLRVTYLQEQSHFKRTPQIAKLQNSETSVQEFPPTVKFCFYLRKAPPPAATFLTLLRTHHLKFTLRSQSPIKTVRTIAWSTVNFWTLFFGSPHAPPRITPKLTKPNHPHSGSFDSSEKNAADELSINPKCLGWEDISPRTF